MGQYHLWCMHTHSGMHTNPGMHKCIHTTHIHSGMHTHIHTTLRHAHTYIYSHHTHMYSHDTLRHAHTHSHHAHTPTKRYLKSRIKYIYINMHVYFHPRTATDLQLSEEFKLKKLQSKAGGRIQCGQKQ